MITRNYEIEVPMGLEKRAARKQMKTWLRNNNIEYTQIVFVGKKSEWPVSILADALLGFDIGQPHWDYYTYAVTLKEEA